MRPRPLRPGRRATRCRRGSQRAMARGRSRRGECPRTSWRRWWRDEGRRSRGTPSQGPPRGPAKGPREGLPHRRLAAPGDAHHDHERQRMGLPRARRAGGAALVEGDELAEGLRPPPRETIFRGALAERAAPIVPPADLRHEAVPHHAFLIAPRRPVLVRPAEDLLVASPLERSLA